MTGVSVSQPWLEKALLHQMTYHLRVKFQVKTLRRSTLVVTFRRTRLRTDPLPDEMPSHVQGLREEAVEKADAEGKALTRRASSDRVTQGAARVQLLPASSLRLDDAVPSGVLQ